MLLQGAVILVISSNYPSPLSLGDKDAVPFELQSRASYLDALPGTVFSSSSDGKSRESEWGKKRKKGKKSRKMEKRCQRRRGGDNQDTHGRGRFDKDTCKYY
ncbi:hypothetical protein FRC15_011970 [Serendipita sp. 397]|nr:hypothetical protein FRC15_011970 [Serendipita sp. 397]